MKKSILLGLGAVAAASAGVAASFGVKPNIAEAKAAVSAAAAVTGASGEILFVSGVTEYFAESGEKSSDLAIYFWRGENESKIETWVRGDRASIHNDTYAVTIPQYNSEDVTWDKCIVTRLNRAAVSPGWGSDVYNQTANISFTDFANPKKNLISPKGYLDKQLDYDLLNTNGVVSGDILYLNVNSSTDWMAAGAKLSCYFFGTTTSAGEPNAWADFGSVVGIGPSSSTVVKIIVPQDSGANVAWRSVIVARFDPKYAGDKPSSFYGNWGQTGDYHFKDAAEDNNVLNLDKDGGGYKVNGAQTFSGSDVANYYGQYFINEVGCDSDGVNKPSGWETVKSAYLALPGSVQTIIAGTTHGASESAIEAAMLTYDWAISHNPTLKNSPTEKFISGRTGNGASAVTMISGNSLNSGALIAGLALFGVAAAGTMVFFAKKRKEI